MEALSRPMALETGLGFDRAYGLHRPITKYPILSFNILECFWRLQLMYIIIVSRVTPDILCRFLALLHILDD
jgi:hypothetical protein